MKFGVVTDYEYSFEHKRDRILVYSGPFYSTLEAEGLSLPNGDGYVLTTYNGDRVRVTTPGIRSGDNYQIVDEAINTALNAHFEGKRFSA